ncbi:MAG: methionyl-tRNA formyltransferase [Salibacteraceae bacterium]
MRIVFFGTPDFAVASLKALVENGKDIVAVVTASDKPAGRGHKVKFPPVKDFALSQKIDVLQPANLKDTVFIERLRSYKADLQIVVAFRMLPEVVWDMPVLGTYNVHASLLPDYRGAAPINWAIINGEAETGITTFKLKHEIDTGSILLQQRVRISKNETAGELYQRLMNVGAELLVKSVEMIEKGSISLTPQNTDGKVKHAPKLFKADGKINSAIPAKELHDFVRGMSPFPGAYLKVRCNDREEVWKIHKTKLTDAQALNQTGFKHENGCLLLAASDFWIEITEIQAEGKRKMNAVDFINGLRCDLQAVEVL